MEMLPPGGQFQDCSSENRGGCSARSGRGMEVGSLILWVQPVFPGVSLGWSHPTVPITFLG